MLNYSDVSKVERTSLLAQFLARRAYYICMHLHLYISADSDHLPHNTGTVAKLYIPWLMVVIPRTFRVLRMILSSVKNIKLFLEPIKLLA